MMDAYQDIVETAAKFGLTLDQLRTLLTETDKSRGLLTPSDLDAALKQIIALYFGVFSVTADRIADPDEKLVVDRYLRQAAELLAEQLSAAPHRPN